jgi:acyl transferase domain-containing protein/acyl carrier protein
MSGEHQERLKNAVAAIQSLRSQLEAAEAGGRDPIAVIGIGCRFPGGANDPRSYWQMLRDGVDAITEVPAERWDVEAHYDPDPDARGKTYTRWGGFVENIDRFDAHFFSISPREAAAMDPQQRMLLEVVWEALEHAGVASPSLAGSDSGVFVGINNNEYYQMSVAENDAAAIDTYSISGGVHSVAAGRLAYILGLHGPAMAIDTACSSSLVAVALACQSLRAGDCRMAIAAGANAMLSPQLTIGLSRLRMMSADGRCKTFDASADGFVQGEGCGAIVLKKLSDAVADGDRVLALLRGWAVNQDGRSAGLTAPNGPAQEAVIRRALQRAGVAAAAIDYVEAHGTGTALGDPIEVRALTRTLVEDRSADHPLRLGSVKTNIGHLGAAAGIAGIIKTILALEAEELPPLLHLRQVNPHIEIDGLPIELVRTSTAWRRSDRPRLAGVSSFGFSGTNAHVIVEEASAIEQPSSETGRLELVTLSAKSDAALGELRHAYAAALRSGSFTLRDFAHTANSGRMQFPYRVAVIGETCDEVADSIEAAEVTIAPAAPAHVTSPLPRNGDRRAFLESVAEQYRSGLVVDFAGLDPQRIARKVTIPTYPFQRQRYWLERTRKESTKATRIETALGDVLYESRLRTGSPPWLDDHRVFGQTVVAGSFYLAHLAEIAAGRSVTDIEFSEPLIAGVEETIVQTVAARDGSAKIFSRRGDGEWTLHCSARFTEPSVAESVDLAGIRARCIEERPGSWWYDEIESSGIEAGPSFRGIQTLFLNDSEALARIVTPSVIDGDVAAIHPALLDACLQTFGPTFHERGSGDTYLPIGIDSMTFRGRTGPAFWCHAVRRDDGHGDLTVFDDRGALVATISGFRIKRVRQGSRLRSRKDLYRLVWQPKPIASRRSVETRVHVAGEGDALDESLRLLHVVQDAIAAEERPRLVVAIDDERPEHAALRGFVSAIHAEYPQWRTSCVSAAALEDELTAADDEVQVSYRDGARHVLRLVHDDVVKDGSVAIREDATYLVTGGTRGAGLAAAEWLARNGARRLVLMARTEPRGDAARTIETLVAGGVEIIIHHGDVSLEADVRAVLAMCGDQLRGVIHSAGVIDDGVLARQSEEKFGHVFAAKVNGTSHLDRLTRDRDLDFFVLFSSLASFIGAAGQANYAAANAFMDAIAQQRRREGLPATSINWGPWSDVGMAADGGEVIARRLSTLGIGSINPRHACELLSALLASDTTQAAVLPSFDVAKFAAHDRAGGSARLLDQLMGELHSAAIVRPASQTVLRFRGVSGEQRDAATRAFVRRSLSEIADMRNGDAVHDDDALADFGFDSLMAVELKNRVELEVGVLLPVSRFLAARSARDVAAFIVEKLACDEIGREVLTL